VILACRDLGKGERALAEIRAQTPDAQLALTELDLADLASIRACAQRLLEDREDLDLLINNAGIMAVPRGLTVDGFESQLGTNHLGHFALTGLLLEALLRRPGARVVSVSSGAHHFGRVNFQNLQGERRYQRWLAYSQSKLANLLFSFELARRCGTAAVDLLSVAAHPGYAATNLQRAGKDNLLDRLYAPIGNRLIAQSAAEGSLPILYAATVAGLPSGSFVGPDGFAELRGHPRIVTASKAAHDRSAAARLWSASEELTGVSYRFG
jgi:NAD(P)-dependent dehydrogenase (short-subunit alcohol dehydrogenase family)